MNEPSLSKLLDSIRKHLDALAAAALSDDDLAHLVAVDEWLADLTGDPKAELERELEERASHA